MIIVLFDAKMDPLQAFTSEDAANGWAHSYGRLKGMLPIVKTMTDEDTASLLNNLIQYRHLMGD